MKLGKDTHQTLQLLKKYYFDKNPPRSQLIALA